ncbi:hypothetical protein EAI_15992 [Harpegnathos saltator]|uniref:CRAL-TRIO domain-containing protein n=1 Tax=Harpegnathos saltator TaxID=610380 RepID=E2BG40_HARSA|nr:hypothetical protein EAI_15992 [Harpegnathos saltator]
MLTDVRLEEDMVNSDILIIDCIYLTLNHLLKYTPNLVRKLDLCLEAYGLRYKSIYIINASSYIDRILKIIKAFMSPKIYGRVNMWYAKLLGRREWLQEQEKVKSNESLRTNSVINADELFGINGTFNKLEID